MSYVIEKKLFGTVVAHARVIEFQKRSQTHAHVIFFLDDRSKNDLRTPAERHTVKQDGRPAWESVSARRLGRAKRRGPGCGRGATLVQAGRVGLMPSAVRRRGIVGLRRVSGAAVVGGNAERGAAEEWRRPAVSEGTRVAGSTAAKNGKAWPLSSAIGFVRHRPLALWSKNSLFPNKTCLFFFPCVWTLSC